jgi:hypothetical protein
MTVVSDQSPAARRTCSGESAGIQPESKSNPIGSTSVERSKWIGPRKHVSTSSSHGVATTCAEATLGSATHVVTAVRDEARAASKEARRMARA